MKLLVGCLTICLALSYDQCRPRTTCTYTQSDDNHHTSCETCTVDNDCTTTTCTSGSVVICQHPAGDGVVANGGLCTCQQTGSGGCTQQSDCFGDGAPNLNCQDSQRHCYDNNCICDRFPGGKK